MIFTIALTLLYGTLAFQTPSTAQRQFEVASIKVNNYAAPGDQRLYGFNGRFYVKNFSLKDIVCWAYDMKDFQVIGGPAWIGSERYDVLATTGDATSDQNVFKEMARSLLADRFKLIAELGSRERSGLVLVVANNGPKLQTPSTNERPYQFASRGSGMIIVTGTNVPVSRLVSFVSDRLEEPIEDKTGLTGSYDYTLTWSAGPRESSPLNNGDPEASSSLTSALLDQLGLRLEKGKAVMDVLTISGAQKPRPD